ncbi:hypothetical protein AAFC00_000185 [Neodothiora populina]|uniref:Glutathione S-transferase n=1 Tax=Neodothiora populina TaxID=2781224 RepID=A0ABR3P215_9PEZI
MATTTDQEAPKVTLYWLEKSRSQRIVWLLEECKIPYEIKIFKRYEKRADPELKKIHPLGKSPVVGIQPPGAAQPIILAESGLITEYFTEHFAPHLAPKRYAEGGKEGPGLETESWFRYRYYMHYAEGSLMPPMVTNLIFNMLKGPSIPYLLRPITRGICDKVDTLYFKPEYATNFSFLESQIATSPDNGSFLCGKDLTAADILMTFPLSAAKERGFMTKDRYPKLWGYIEMMEGLEGAKAAVKKIEEMTGESYKLVD